MNYKDHVANKNTTERIKSPLTTSPSGAERSLSLNTNRMEDSSPPWEDSHVDTIEHSSSRGEVSQPSEREQSTCTICLNTYEDRAVLQSCHHEFCFCCILQWSTISHTCPLCIRPFTSCMYEIKDDQQYTIHQFEPLPRAQTSSGIPVSGAPHGIIRRLYGPPQWRRRARNRPPRAIPESADELSVSERQRAALENRRNIYRKNLYVRHMGANRISGFQQITPESFRIFPHRLDRLVPWIRRELQAITTLSATTTTSTSSTSDTITSHPGPESHHEDLDPGLEIIREYIIAVCKQYDLQTDKGQDLIRDFLHEHTEHFVHELMSFARSPFSIESYDRAAQYGPSSCSSSSMSTSAVAKRASNHRSVINSENQEDQRRSERRRRRESPEYSGRAGDSSREERRDGKRSRRNNLDQDMRSYSSSEDTDSAVQSQSTSRARTITRSTSHNSSASSSRSKVGSSLNAKNRLTGETDKDESSRDSTPAPSKTDLQTILLAKLKREQDLYHATRTSSNANHPPETKR